MSASNAFGSPIPLSEIESVLAWVDTFKLSRPTKKINRDFSDAVLLAEILSGHYPKLVEMHNYPPRNSHALKLNNWMTLNRKVLKKLKLNLCNNTMEQLANAVPGIIERVLIMVRDKIKRDEDAEKAAKEGDQNMSSGGSYYEACGDDENVLVVPVKLRVKGVLETVQQKVVSYDAYTNLKEELKDAKETCDTLKQKVNHLDSLIKVKDERINELQKQLDRKQLRRKDSDSVLQQNNSDTMNLPYEEPTEPSIDPIAPSNGLSKHSLKAVESKTIHELNDTKSETEIPLKGSKEQLEIKASYTKVTNVQSATSVKKSRSKISIKNSFNQLQAKISHSSEAVMEDAFDVDRIKSDVFQESESGTEQIDYEEVFIDTEQINTKDKIPSDKIPTTIEDAIHKEVIELIKPIDLNVNNDDYMD